jgi:glucosamine 6-phosphate synthetase-like amidotransferase/phosphosugar isomerase protein
MCGIAAVLLQPKERPPEMWAEIQQCFTANLLFNEERGREASGVGLVKLTGETAVYKAPLPARQLAQQPSYNQLLAQLDAQSTLLLGHARHPTKGSPQNIHNNHPLQAGMVIGVHNGHIHNDDALFDNGRYPRQGQVDSEIIFRLLWHELPQPFARLPLPDIARTLQPLEGKFTILAADRRAPETLLVARQNNPLSLHYHPEWAALIFSSRYIFLRKTFGPAVLYEMLPNNRIFLYNSFHLSQNGATAVSSWPLGAVNQSK